MNLPDTIVLRVEPLHGLCGPCSDEGSTICPLCGNTARFSLKTGSGHCPFCHAAYSSVDSIVEDSILGEFDVQEFSHMMEEWEEAIRVTINTV